MAKGSFALNIRKFAQRAKENADEVVRRAVIEIGDSLVLRTPVGNPKHWDADFKEAALKLGWYGEGYTGGRLRANWQLQAESPATGVLDEIDPTGEPTRAKFNTLAASMQAGGLIYYSNNLPYALRIEDGYSKRAPEGMVAVTRDEFRDYVRKAIRELPK
ncbi:hypothetical protein [Alcaligenes endophyticus]|uniref:HK97 gp10 family phage protein n=1 Tax=Alcaligenes endophyticus TaxID=1929088 RepID=A0ABT8EIY3_9BURK|nr:hypothetical protein [Alcaligenes endophyticus]MCX5592531.1 hypothetical protein [Alcaligenes endophyticus]MDN4121257.1 hypothetical protein [Alcaligenes endophyticus]